MRIQFITKRLAIGGAINEQETMDYVLEQGVTHFLCLTSGCDKRFLQSGGEVLHIYMPDDGTWKPYRYFAAGVEWAVDALRYTNNCKLLVHCAAGRNRSTSMAYAILRALGRSSKAAEKLIMKRYARPLEERDPNFPPLLTIRYKDNVDYWFDNTDIGRTR